MRPALGILFLVLLFVAATLVQESWIDEVRDRLPGLQLQAEDEVLANASAERAREGWARLVIGGPSGAEPVTPPGTFHERNEERRMLVGNEPEFEAIPEDIPPAPPSDFEITLDSSSTLSELCVRFYGSGAPKLYQRLAEYNGFDDANAIRAGQKLLVPATRELLFSK